MATRIPREVFSTNYRTRTLISSRCRHNSLMMISMLKTSLTEYSQASADKKSQREIADVAGVADVTIRQTFLFSPSSFVALKRRKEGLKPPNHRQSYKLLLPRASELFPEDFNFTTPVAHLPQNWSSHVWSLPEISLKSNILQLTDLKCVPFFYFLNIFLQMHGKW